MIYEYKALYDAANNIIGYEYNIITGYDASSNPILATFTLVADGVINDRQAFQDLLIEINNQDGGMLILPPNRTIGIDSLVQLRDNITIKSTGNTIIKDLGGATTMFQCFGRKNVVVDNLIFQGSGTTTTALAIRQSSDGNEIRGKNIIVQNCEFVDMTFKAENQTASCITAKNINDLIIRNCTFSKSSAIGISINEENKNVYIENNLFEGLEANPIRVTGVAHKATDSLWIIGNEMNVARTNSYILDNETSRTPEGVVILPSDDDSLAERRNLTGISAINIAISGHETTSTHHQNVVIADNIANGSDYGFYDGGSADLYSVKDIERLKCYGNTARDSGDLGFAIERCHYASINNNIADRNNSCGISIFDSSNIAVVGNVCMDNELARDGIYENSPYGGIRVERDSYSVIVEGNHFSATSSVKRSLVNAISGGEFDYNEPNSPTQTYGVVVRPSGKRGVDENDEGYTYFVKPSAVKVGVNHAVGTLWGEVYNKMRGTQLVDTYTGFTFPTDADYPLGARLRNSLISTSTSAVKEWVVAHRIELEVKTNTLPGQNSIDVNTVFQNYVDIDLVPFNNFVLQNTDLTTISTQSTGYDGDVIGIMLDDYSIHWTRVSAVTDIVVTDPENATCKLTLADPLPDNVSAENTIVSLRWEAL